MEVFHKPDHAHLRRVQEDMEAEVPVEREVAEVPRKDFPAAAVEEEDSQAAAVEIPILAAAAVVVDPVAVDLIMPFPEPPM